MKQIQQLFDTVLLFSFIFLILHNTFFVGFLRTTNPTNTYLKKNMQLDENATTDRNLTKKKMYFIFSTQQVVQPSSLENHIFIFSFA